MLKVKNGKLILRNVEEKNLYIENGKIFAITAENLLCNEEIDARGQYVCPGFIDTHVHGGGGGDFMDGGAAPMVQAAKAHLRHGTTTLCPTTLTSSFETLVKTVEDYAKLAAEGRKDLPCFAGLHLEGPYLALSQAGAQPPQYIYPPKPEEYEKILSMGEGLVKKWTFAPELPGAAAFCDAMVKKGVIPCIGHTDGTFEDALRAYEHGAKCLTHFYSSMSTIKRIKGYRVPGVVEAGYLLDGLQAEIIGDGCHLPPTLLKMICKCKGKEKLLLITDAMRGADLPDGPSLLGRKGEGMPCIIEDGVAKMTDRSGFAGSVATMDRVVRTMVQQAECTLPEAVAMASAQPAQLLGLKEKGSLAPGFDADLVFLSDDLQVTRVLLGGKPV